MLRSKILSLLVVVVIGVIAASCGKDNNDTEAPALPEPPSEAPNVSALPETGNGESDTNGKNETSEIVRGEATRVDRGGETYDYSGWLITAGSPDLFFLIDAGWNRLVLAKQDFSDLSYYTIWTDAESTDSEIVMRLNMANISSPEDAVTEKVAAIKREGIDVEYGEFKSGLLPDGFFTEYNAWLPEAWYYSRKNIDTSPENDDWNIQIFFNLGTINPNIGSLSLRLSDLDIINSNTISEENFYKMANSFYIGGRYEEYYLALTGDEKSTA